MNAGVCLRGVLISLYVASVSATPPTSTPTGSWKELQEVLRDRTLPADRRDSAGYSLVYYHLKFGSEERALELLEKMPPTKVHMEGRDRLLTSAVKQGSQRMVQRLLQMGESPNVLKPGEISPLMTATKEGEFEIMRMLMTASTRLGFAPRSRYSASCRRRKSISASNDSRGRSKSPHHRISSQVSRTIMESALSTP